MIVERFQCPVFLEKKQTPTQKIMHTLGALFAFWDKLNEHCTLNSEQYIIRIDDGFRLFLSPNVLIHSQWVDWPSHL